MKPSLVDVNVVLALLVRQHEHHTTARNWFETLAEGEVGLCRIVQLTVIRLLGNRSVMGDYALPASAAWDVLTQLLEDERIEFLPEPPDLDQVLPALFHHRVPTHNLIAGAYLAACAISANRTLVTLDTGFRQFKTLSLTVLSAP